MDVVSVIQKIDQGIKLLNKAATRGHVQSMQTLAKIYETGQYELEIDMPAAKKWRACAAAEPKLLAPSSPTPSKTKSNTPAKTAMALQH